MECTVFVDGVFEIQFLPESQTKFDKLPKQEDPFMAVESSAYFEAYKHVLNGMKQLNVANFPFIKHIVRYGTPIEFVPPYFNLQLDFIGVLNWVIWLIDIFINCTTGILK